ncbi:hypothetical protein [Pseudomonas tohonis]|uniref:hypothetical protein n=1 Tax=Pseudomonas tohonis TaxID=2725477 RepID=UPI001F303D8C|nr:hypothetical protein [Pseudomonas tohonis]
MSSTTKNAQYTLKIKADSGYRSDESGRTDAECYRVALAALAGDLGTNLNLLAASTALLEALEAITDLYDTDEGCRSTPEYIAARAAIAKARGEP